LRIDRFIKYAAAKCREEDLWNHYNFTCLRANASGFHYQKTNEPPQPQKYTTEYTLPTWEEFINDDHTEAQVQTMATDEELNEILYGDRNFVE
jgi:hypothetical protein